MLIHIPSLDRAKQIAGWLRKHSGVARQKSLNIVADMHGYEGWDHLLARWMELDNGASKSTDTRHQQFVASMKRHEISNTSVIMDLIDPVDEESENTIRISISRDDIAKEAAKYDPRVKAAEARLEFYHTSGDPTGLVMAATQLLQTVGKHQTSRFFELLTLNQGKTPEAALFATSLYLAGYMQDTDGSIVTNLFETALRSENPDISTNAHYGLGVHLRKIDLKRAMRHMQIAVDADCAPAKFAMALCLETGAFGYDEDPERAIQLYIECHENHGHELAKLSIAKAIVFGNRNELPYDAEELLSELAGSGQKEAEVILKWIKTRRRHATLDIRLPSTVTPNGGNRPKMVRDALKAQFGLPETLLEAVTATFYGYETWKALLGASSNKKTTKGPHDEDCDTGELAERKKFQAYILTEYFGLGDMPAEVALDLLQPTARTGKPSLKDLERGIERRKLMPRLGGDYDAIRKMAEMLGIGDPDDIMSLIYGAVPMCEEESDLLEALEEAYASGNHDLPDEAFRKISRGAPELLSRAVELAERHVEISPWALCHQAIAKITIMPQDPDAARRLLRRQLVKYPTWEKRSFALALLGEVERGDYGGKRNEKAALAYLRESASLGSPQGAFAAALLISERQSVKSQNEAISMYRTAIKLGSVESMTNLALLFFRQRRVEHFDEAMHLMRKAAASGDRIAIDFLATEKTSGR
jgi:TPR repeat protein